MYANYFREMLKNLVTKHGYNALNNRDFVLSSFQNNSSKDFIIYLNFISIAYLSGAVGILLNARNSKEDNKIRSIIFATSQLKAHGIEESKAYDVISLFTYALGWDSNEKFPPSLNTYEIESKIKKELDDLPDDIENIDLSGQSIFSIPNDLFRFKQLKSLNLAGNNLKNIDALKNIPSIIELDLRLNNIECLTSLSNLGKLRILELGENIITDVSPLLELKYLRKLDLSLNGLADISLLSRCSTIVNLNLTGNKIYDISPVSEMKSLSVLKAGSNNIDELRPLSRLKKLRDVELRDNKIKNLPIFNQLENCLELLNLNNNQIEDISPVKDYFYLKELHLNGNGIEDISYLSTLHNLKSLSLGFNKITDIYSLLKCDKLTLLDLRYNNITDASILMELPHLREVILNGNHRINKKQIYEINELLDSRKNNTNYSI